MSFSADVFIPKLDGPNVIATFYDSIIDDEYSKLLETYRDIIEVTTETIYDISFALKEVESQYSIAMYNSELDDSGWTCWVNELDDPIVVPLSELPSAIESYYTLKGERVMCIDSEPSKYNSWVRKNNLTYIYTGVHLSTALAMFPNKHRIRSFDSNILICNSY